MKDRLSTADIVFRLCFFSALSFGAGLFIFILFFGEVTAAGWAFFGFPAAFVACIPAAAILIIIIPMIQSLIKQWRLKLLALLIGIFCITLLYGIPVAASGLFQNGSYGMLSFLRQMFLTAVILLSCTFIAFLFCLKELFRYFNRENFSPQSFCSILKMIFTQSPKIHNIMEENEFQPAVPQHSNRILIKGIITGGLILIMLIPTLFINNLISEREARQKEVVKEVSSKWAAAQTITGPFLAVPYTDTFVNSEGKAVTVKTKLLLLANELNVNGKLIPEERPRSIYKVLLYKTDIAIAGNFKVVLPADINAAAIDYANAKLCFSLSDFKGIEEEIFVNFNGQRLQLTPGLPVDDFGNTGLSVPVSINPENAVAGIPFSMQVKIKGSEQLHFIPASATSKFQITSAWPNPSFDGNSLPSIRNITNSGFSADWNFNRANLPFGTVVKTNTISDKAVSFGVSLVQPADQYNKTMRSVKYAILFIGLTFAFFFIIELMQKKPFHPVQYILVGLALVIFYSLLLSISEYILFDYAYLVAAAATVLLISFYAKGHFQSWKTAGIFFALLSCLYGFIFILIRLEDTALLVGSIGLFIVLALVMYVSRRINWYGQSPLIQK